MKRKICVRSMGLGAVMMLIGLAVGTIVSPPLVAQRNGVFGDIKCTGLTVVDKQGNVAVALDTDDANGSVLVFGKDGGAAAMNINADGGSVAVYNNQGTTCVLVSVNEDGGFVSVINNQGKPRAAMGVTEYGDGVVSTWDKNGYRQ